MYWAIPKEFHRIWEAPILCFRGPNMKLSYRIGILQNSSTNPLFQRRPKFCLPQFSGSACPKFIWSLVRLLGKTWVCVMEPGVKEEVCSCHLVVQLLCVRCKNRLAFVFCEKKNQIVLCWTHTDASFLIPQLHNLVFICSTASSIHGWKYIFFPCNILDNSLLSCFDCFFPSFQPCPICSDKIAKDMLNHITVQHGYLFKVLPLSCIFI